MKNNNYKKVQFVLFIILLANLFVAIIKIGIGILIQSASITADGLHSLSDGSSNIVGLVGIHLASKPMDRDHPYGHGKFETLSGLIISVMLFCVGGKVILDAIEKFRYPVTPSITVPSLILLLLTLIINIFVTVIEYRNGIQLKSQILISDSMHTRSDIYVSIGVLLTLVVVKLGIPSIIDPIASLFVSGFIIHAAYEIFKDNSNVLVDRAVVNTEDIKLLVMKFEQVKDADNIRSRGTINNLYIDLHLMIEPELSIQESHKLVHEIENVIKDEFNANAQVFAHLEPYDGINKNTNSKFL